MTFLPRSLIFGIWQELRVVKLINVCIKTQRFLIDSSAHIEHPVQSAALLDTYSDYLNIFIFIAVSLCNKKNLIVLILGKGDALFFSISLCRRCRERLSYDILSLLKLTLHICAGKNQSEAA